LINRKILLALESRKKPRLRDTQKITAYNNEDVNGGCKVFFTQNTAPARKRFP
jgi:hypothetical protein